MSKKKTTPLLKQSEIGKYWTRVAVAQKYGVPPTNIIRAAKGVEGMPKIRSLKLCGGTGIEVYYEPDVKAYAKVYKPIRKRNRSKICNLRALKDRGRSLHWVPIKSDDGGAICGKIGDWGAPLKSAGKQVCGRCKIRSGRYQLKKR